MEEVGGPCEGAQRDDVLLQGVVGQLSEGDVEGNGSGDQTEPATGLREENSIVGNILRIVKVDEMFDQAFSDNWKRKQRERILTPPE